MSYRIIADSCCDRTERLAKWDNITFVPLTLQIGDYKILDDENFDQEDYVRRTIEYNGVAKTACPSPAAWAEAFDCGEDDLYVITITDKLSGTYNSALQGAQLYKDEHPESSKNIHVFNSLATSGNEILIAEEIKKLADSGMAFDEIVSTIEDFIANHTELYFCLDSLDVLKKNGRLFAVAASILKKLRLKMIFKAVDGNISYVGQDIAMNRSLIKMAATIAKNLQGIDLSEKHLIVSHVCCEDRARLVADKIKAGGANFGEVEVIKMCGLNTTYASNGGIIVSYTK